jgi:hypothetical protein
LVNVRIAPFDGAAVLACERGDIDDTAIAAHLEFSGKNLAADESTAHVDGHDGVEIGRRDIEHGLGRRDRGIVDQRIDASPAREQRIACTLDGRLVADIQR